MENWKFCTHKKWFLIGEKYIFFPGKPTFLAFVKGLIQSCLLFWPGKNQESWALDLELEDLKLLCPDGTEAGLHEYLQCHLSAVPANGVVVRVEDKCRVWKYLERLQVE